MNKKSYTLKETFADALEYYNKKDFKLTEKICYKILTIDPNNFDSISLLASVSAHNKDFEKAKDLLLKAIQIKPDSTSTLNNLGTAYRELKMFKQSMNFYKKVLEINPNNTNANYCIGLVFYSLKELKKAKSYFIKTVEIQNNYAMAFFSLANVHVDLKEFKEALSCYQKSIEINPKLVSAHNNLGLLYRSLNDEKNAIKSYQDALKLAPNYINAIHNLAQLYKEIGDFKKSIEYRVMTVKIEPNNLANYYFLSELQKNIFDANFKKKITNIINNKESSYNNLAYGNYLLAKFEEKNKNYGKEFNYLTKGHKNFYKTNKEKFDLGIKYCFDDVHQIMIGSKISKNLKKNDIKMKPIFIFGVPRCGSTLIERVIVSGKKFIPVGEETGVIGSYIHERVLKKEALNLGEADEIREELYEIYKLRGLISEKYNYIFTDKSLDNFFYLKFINEIFPDVKLINCKTNILSSIVSIFKNNLTELAWAHDIENIFKYFDNYFNIIENYKTENPNNIYELDFDKFILSPIEQSKKLMEYCELPWDEKCLKPEERKDLISKTASNIQIRKSIFKQKSNKYSPYKVFLEKYGKSYSWFK